MPALNDPERFDEKLDQETIELDINNLLPVTDDISPWNSGRSKTTFDIQDPLVNRQGVDDLVYNYRSVYAGMSGIRLKIIAPKKQD